MENAEKSHLRNRDLEDLSPDGTSMWGLLGSRLPDSLSWVLPWSARMESQFTWNVAGVCSEGALPLRLSLFCRFYGADSAMPHSLGYTVGFPGEVKTEVEDHREERSVTRRLLVLSRSQTSVLGQDTRTPSVRDSSPALGPHHATMPRDSFFTRQLRESAHASGGHTSRLAAGICMRAANSSRSCLGTPAGQHWRQWGL